jgi:cytochrome c oxidase subunit 2
MRRVRTIGVALLAALLLGGCGTFEMYDPVTEQGKDIRDLYNLLLVAATVVFVLVEGAIVFAVVRYRRRDDQLPPQFHGNNLLEVAWTVAPFLLVAVLFVLGWVALNRIEARADNPRVVLNVEGFQWQWNFTYQDEKVEVEPGKPPEDLTIKGTIAKPPEIYLPVNQTIEVNTEARDVIHSFYVREFLFKRDAFPGHVNTFPLTITKPGVYQGQCTEYCGLAHQAMRFTIHAVPMSEYRAWLVEAKKRAASGCPEDTTPGQIAADRIAFDKPCLTAEAGKPFTLKFDNREAVDHNVTILQGPEPDSEVAFRGPIFKGPMTVDYPIPALKAGRHFYRCDVHAAAMTGTLVARSR